MRSSTTPAASPTPLVAEGELRWVALASPPTTARPPGRAPGRLTARCAAAAVLRCIEATGIAAKRVSPLVLRRTFAIRALRTGGNVVAVSNLLGHSSLTTTQRYVDHLATAELRPSIPTCRAPWPDAPRLELAVWSCSRCPARGKGGLSYQLHRRRRGVLEEEGWRP